MTPHLRGHVRAYVDRAMPGPILRSFDQHLVYCVSCRAVADQERRIVASLRADTGVSQALRASLLGLASVAPADEPRVPAVPGGPVPYTPFGMPLTAFRERVPTVPPQSPALHRSPMRAAVVASLAVGASVAASWSLVVTPLPTASVGRAPSALVPAGVSTLGAAAVVPVGFGSRSGSGRSGATSETAVARVIISVRSSVSAVLSGASAGVAASAPARSVLLSAPSELISLSQVRHVAFTSAQSGP